MIKKSARQNSLIYCMVLYHTNHKSQARKKYCTTQITKVTRKKTARQKSIVRWLLHGTTKKVTWKKYRPTYPQTYRPIDLGTYQLANLPIYQLSDIPTYQPTDLPIYRPTNLPTYRPTDLLTYQPTNQQTYRPTVLPTYCSTVLPTYWPTDLMTYRPTNLLTYRPTGLTTYRPTDLLIYRPTGLPIYWPSDLPTYGTTELKNYQLTERWTDYILYGKYCRAQITTVSWKKYRRKNIYCTVLYGTINKSYLKKNSVLLLYGTIHKIYTNELYLTQCVTGQQWAELYVTLGVTGLGSSTP